MAPVRPLTLAELLGNLDEVAAARLSDRHVEDRLVRSRLGAISALFAALRAKHPPTARHSLRVALWCSLIGDLVKLESTELDHLEVAALLHDIGKIAVPDQLINKAGPLTADELEVLRGQRSQGLEILAACSLPPAVSDIVRHCCVPFDGGGRLRAEPVGDAIPCGARILAIADAYDAMTSDRVYRPAMSRERAVAELFAAAGTQFDPQLVERFAWSSPQAEAEIRRRVSLRWLQPVSVASAPVNVWTDPSLPAPADSSALLSVFQHALIDGIHDGIAFVDVRGRILLWNTGAERLTGQAAESVLEREWHSELLDLRDMDGNCIRERGCPVRQVAATGAHVVRRLTLTRPTGERLAVDLQVMPVMNHHCKLGAAVLLRDASCETILEARVQHLSQRATKDPLTGVSNRAEFDQVHADLVELSLRQGTTFSIILCDVDHFKQVNDQFGHQKGDVVLVQFASLLQQWSRRDDLVARFGGEEFVVLCPDCDIATAVRCAERFRIELAQTPQPGLDQHSVTASFGVTELQPGDTPETMLRRADRALYQAKDGGRNRVVELGAGFTPDAAAPRRGWLSWLRRRPVGSLVQRTLVTCVPLNVAAEKVRGFIADHEAEIVSIEENHVVLAVALEQFEPRRRSSDRPASLLVDLQVCEIPPEQRPRAGYGSTRTVARVTIRLRRGRDRRARSEEHAALVLSSLKSYLIAQESADL